LVFPLTLFLHLSKTEALRTQLPQVFLQAAHLPVTQPTTSQHWKKCNYT